MKPSLIHRLLALALLAAAGAPARSLAQELPSPGLQLPPRPALTAAAPAVSRPAGLPGGPAPVFVPISHLTLPEKPSVTGLITAASVTSAAPEEEEIPATEGPVPEDLLQPGENPLLPAPPPDGPAPEEAASDLLPALDAPVAPGLIEIQPSPEDPAVPPVEVPAGGIPNPEPGPVPASDLSPVPDKTPDSADPNARGPLFRVKGADAFRHARTLGYRFTPAMGSGRRDGIHTVASQVPNVLTSEVHGTRMMQLRPSPLWTTPYIENTFYMFCDASYNAVRLQPGWKIRGIQLKGPNWQWVACPKSGANTASFSVRIRAWKTIDTPAQGSVVNLEGLTLEGPPGATDWKAAFPTLLRPAAMSVKR